LSDYKILERKILLKRLLPRDALFQIGKSFGLPCFQAFNSLWDIDEDQAVQEIAIKINDVELEQIFKQYKNRDWEVFKGQYYTFEGGQLRIEGSWDAIQAAIKELKTKYGKNLSTVLNCLLQSEKGCSVSDVKKQFSDQSIPLTIFSDLEAKKVVVTSYESKDLTEWTLLEETSPLIRQSVSLKDEIWTNSPLNSATLDDGETDFANEEKGTVERMDREFNDYVASLFKNRLQETVEFGRKFSISYIADYLKQLFGPVLFFDSLLSITQQYGLADVDIIHPKGRTGMRTGWNLSLFGEPGTGKSFSVRDIILGKMDAKIPAHGIPGRNRYAGGITPAKFIRIGQAYSGRVFNFIVPEFNDWFKYRGMVEPLKLAMERGEIKWETQKETIGPYRFSSFFSVNYNVEASSRGYEVTVQDPNFSAIEDRMLCRLHKLTKERFVEIAESQMRLAFGETDLENGAQNVRDHLSLVYAIQVRHPFAKDRFMQKPVMLTSTAQNMFTRARKAILEEIKDESVRFSARLEDRAIRFASAASQLAYFQSDFSYIPISEEALRYAIQLYVEEASVRSQEEFEPKLILGKLGLN
jgi:hypothetical protein